MRSEQRAQSFGEVFTPEGTVRDMLDLLPKTAFDVTTTFLEPSCGNGNFLVEILERKLRNMPKDSSRSKIKMDSALALASIYGVDIEAENVSEARDRIYAQVKSFAKEATVADQEFLSACLEIISANIVIGDAIDNPSQIALIQYEKTSPIKIEREIFFLEQPEMDLFFVHPAPMDPIIL